jgi:hypothetical protein
VWQCTKRKKKLREKILLTVPGGKIASNLSTPNMPRFERVNVPVE